MARPKVRAKGFPRRAPENLMFIVSEVNQKSPHICAICEEGGELIIFDGPCHRQFHPSVDSDGARDYQCPSVNFPRDHQGGFTCGDCREGQSMCFGCHIVGMESTKVRQCPFDDYVRWYYHNCLVPEAESCNLHKCQTCSLSNSGDGSDLVQCLRCPKAWHEGCLEFIIERGFNPGREVWKHKAHNTCRSFIYCPAHDIDLAFAAPPRNHISWL